MKTTYPDVSPRASTKIQLRLSHSMDFQELNQLPQGIVLITFLELRKIIVNEIARRSKGVKVVLSEQDIILNVYLADISFVQNSDTLQDRVHFQKRLTAIFLGLGIEFLPVCIHEEEGTIRILCLLDHHKAKLDASHWQKNCRQRDCHDIVFCLVLQEKASERNPGKRRHVSKRKNQAHVSTVAKIILEEFQCVLGDDLVLFGREMRRAGNNMVVFLAIIDFRGGRITPGNAAIYPICAKEDGVECDRRRVHVEARDGLCGKSIGHIAISGIGKIYRFFLFAGNDS